MGCAWCRDQKEDYFISIDDFKTKASDKKFIAVDCSTGADAEAKYKLQRLPEAQFLGQKWTVADPPKSIKDCMDKLGVGTDSNVVCYDNENGTQAMNAAAFIHACGVKSVQVLMGKWADEKDWKKAEKDQEPVKKATGTGAAWKDLPKEFWFSSEQMNTVQSGVKTATIVDMRSANDFSAATFHKSSVNIEMDKVWVKSTFAAVTQTDVDKMLADKKVDRTVQVVICGGGADATSMFWCLKGQDFKQVAIYTATHDDHKVMIAAAAKKAEEDKKKAADDKKAADVKKPETDATKPDAPAEKKPEVVADAPKAEEKAEVTPKEEPAE